MRNVTAFRILKCAAVFVFIMVILALDNGGSFKGIGLQYTLIAFLDSVLITAVKIVKDRDLHLQKYGKKCIISNVLKNS